MLTLAVVMAVQACGGADSCCFVLFEWVNCREGQCPLDKNV